MNFNVRIPTIVGLGVLIIGLAAGVWAVNQRQVIKSQASPSEQPNKISVANVADTSVSIFWFTNSPATGFIKAGVGSALDQIYKDDQDFGSSPRPRTIHFVTLNGLQPSTTYNYKIFTSDNDGGFPAKSFNSFTTVSSNNNQPLAPLIGVITDAVYQPAGGALVELQIPNAQPLAAITKSSGNFIIPLSNLRTTDLSQSFSFESGVKSTMIITKDGGQTVLNIPLPYTAQTLPPIVLGQNQSFFDPSPSPTPTTLPLTYDLNHDGIVNTLDLSVVIQNRGKNPKNKAADINHDGVVDEKDINALTEMIKR
jgi:hypothetical protein